MAKLHVLKAVYALDDKINELNQRIEIVRNDETLSKNTRQTRAYGFRKESRALVLMREFLKLHTSQKCEEIEIPDLYLDYFKSLTTLSAERVINDKVIVHKGDTLMALLQKYDGRKDILAKIQKACESAGLTLNMATGIVE